MNNGIPADVLDKINTEADKHGFQVPYDGSNNFYTPNKVESFQAGAIYGYKLSDDEVKELRKAVIEGSELHVNFTTYKEQLTSANKRIEELQSALHKIMELADDGASLKLIYDGAEEALNK